MGVRVLENQKEGMAVLYDSVTETAFGPIIREWEPDGPTIKGDYADAREVAEAFLRWLGDEPQNDPRRMLPADVVTEYGNFVAELERDGWKAVTDAVSV